MTTNAARLALLLAPALALAGCGRPAGEGGDNVTVAVAATPAPAASRPLDTVAKVRALPDRQRDGVLFRAIRDAGQPCQGVKQARDVSQPGGASAWLVTCDDNGQWVVGMAGDGTATVASAADVAKANGQ